MHLVMFDIDGTLTQSCAVDDNCFVRAACEVLKVPSVASDWSKYRNVTDSGITSELIRVAFGRDPRQGEIDAVRQRFVLYLNESLNADASRCRSVDGAAQIIPALLAQKETSVALATGGWGESARVKLRSAGLDIGDVAFASADDAVAREEIMLLAAARAARQRGVINFESHVYVGDGIWDLHAARNLGFGFVGIGAGEKAKELTRAGAIALFTDFCDIPSFLHGLCAARPIGQRTSLNNSRV